MIPDMPKPKRGITLTAENAAVVLDIVDLLSGPVGPEQAAYALRQARFLVPIMEAAFEQAGIEDIDAIERPEIPFMVPGSKAKE